MYDFTILRVKPEDLPQDRVYSLKWGYDTELSDFIVSVDLNSKTIWVNRSVLEKDIKQFVEVINFPYSYVCDEDMGMGGFLAYVYDKYGYGTYSALIKAHSKRRKRECEVIAKERIRALVPTFHKQLEEIDIDEFLLYAAHSIGYSLDMKTPNNMVNYGDEYVFILGYLMGNGTVRNDLIGKAV